VYLTAVAFVSVTLSMYFLVWFYFTMVEDLKKYNPVPKFLCIKSILFFSFWQGVFIAILAYFNVIPENAGNWTQDNISRGLQDFIICIEMFLLSLTHFYVFSHEPYKIEHVPWYKSTKKALAEPMMNFAVDVVNQKDVVTDMKNAYHPKNVIQAKKKHKEVKDSYKLKMSTREGSKIDLETDSGNDGDYSVHTDDVEGDGDSDPSIADE